MISNFKNKSKLWTITAVFLIVLVRCTGLTNSKISVQSKNISDVEFKNLVLNSYKSITGISSLRSGIDYKEIDGRSYEKFKTDLKAYVSVYQYLDEELSLNKYFTKNFINRFAKHISTEKNGHYYIMIGDFGIGIKDAKLTSRTWDADKLNVTFNGIFNDNETIKFNATIIYYGNWKFDKIDIWGFNFKDN